MEQQGKNLDVISDELLNTNKNMTHTVQNLEEASTYQKKSKKKYIILVIVIIIIIVIVAGIVFFLAK